jgi:hypothetical protein
VLLACPPSLLAALAIFGVSLGVGLGVGGLFVAVSR